MFEFGGAELLNCNTGILVGPAPTEPEPINLRVDVGLKGCRGSGGGGDGISGGRMPKSGG